MGFGSVERARKRFVAKQRKEDRKFAGMSVKEAVAAHNRKVDQAFKAAATGKIISLTDLFASAERVADKKRGLL